MNCPNCGQRIPEEAGQHAVVPDAEIIDCPSCGARVNMKTGKLASRSSEGRAEEQGGAPIPEGAPDSFSGETTLEGVMEEVEEKEQ
jgi:DNA-directed RNA polymerase subunit RPC12/RpoP